MVLPIEEAPWHQKSIRVQEAKDAWMKGFRDAKPELEAMLETGEILYIYYNGYILRNQPNIKGGIFNNNATVPWNEAINSDYGNDLWDKLQEARR